jgi:hypothetical protein
MAAAGGRRAALLALGLCLISAPAFGSTGSAATACKPGFHRVDGELVKTFCGPAVAVVRVGGRALTFRSGRCSTPDIFRVNIGTLSLGYAVRYPYFSLVVAAYDDGTYHARDFSGISFGVAFSTAGRDWALRNATITLKRHLTRGSFSGVLQTGQRVTGSFTC